MPGFKEMNDVVSLADQMHAQDDGPVVLVNVFSVDPADEDALVAAWAHDAEFMKQQPGYISTQLHKGIAGSSTFFNYAIWESAESFHQRGVPGADTGLPRKCGCLTALVQKNRRRRVLCGLGRALTSRC